MFIFNFYGFVLEKIGFKKKIRNVDDSYYPYKRKGTEDGETINFVLRNILGWCSLTVIVGMFVAGSVEANNPERCRINKIADAIITAPYALGCNLFKNRFDVKLN